jgi:uncharacterized membrane protein required for colicin V production
MTWIDITIIIVIGLGTYVGFKVGLIRAVLSAIACVLGLFLAGQLSDDIGSFLSESISSDTVITVISYIVIVVVCLLASSIATKIIKPILTALTAGLSNLADKVGGIVLGALIGCAISSGLILGLARLTYSFDTTAVSSTITSNELGNPLAKIEKTQESLQNALVKSEIVTIFITIHGILPSRALGFIPQDFSIALDTLDKQVKIEREFSEESN